jgi:hypothetical protein
VVTVQNGAALSEFGLSMAVEFGFELWQELGVVLFLAGFIVGDPVV